MRTNAIVHLSRAVEKIAVWDPPMRFNDTTRYYFEKLATISNPEDAARYKGLFDPAKAPAIREYLAENDPGTYSLLHTSISPNIFQGGFQVNVIPSEATATLDIRALPEEDMPAFLDMMRKVINDPAIDIVPETSGSRPSAANGRITELRRRLGQTADGAAAPATSRTMSVAARRKICCCPEEQVGGSQGSQGWPGETKAEDERGSAKPNWRCCSEAVGKGQSQEKDEAREVTADDSALISMSSA